MLIKASFRNSTIATVITIFVLSQIVSILMILHFAPKIQPQDWMNNTQEKVHLQATFNLRHFIPILIIACDRVEYLEATLSHILKYHPKRRNPNFHVFMPTIISQEGNNTYVSRIVNDYCYKIFPRHNIPCLYHRYEHDLRNDQRGSNNESVMSIVAPRRIRKRRKFKKNFESDQVQRYEHLSGHYKFALQYTFSKHDYKEAGRFSKIVPEQAIILEDDIIISPDFFYYFISLANLLKNDDSLLAISAWNDNGRRGHVKDTSRLLRTDFFPGLGWMMPRRLWTEVEGKWPAIYWDDWLRDPNQRQGRETIRPEVSRSYHIGVSGGASGIQNNLTYMTDIHLNKDLVKWNEMKSSYLKPIEFESVYMKNVSSAGLRSSLTEALEAVRSGDIRLQYESMKEFRRFAVVLKLRYDSRSEILRTSYRGIVESRPFGDHILYLVPGP